MMRTQPWGKIMNFYKYVQSCEKLVLELKDALTPADIDELRKDCRILGLAGWDRWFFDHLAPISAFLAATPSEREKLEGWQNPVQKRRLVLASLQQLIRGCNLLEGIHIHGIGPGQSYRHMASKAAEAYMDIFMKQPASDWPFDDPDPFTDE